MGSQRVGYDLVTERQLLSQPVTHNATASRWMKEIWTGICFYVWKPISCSVLYFTRERNLKILLSSFHMMFPHSETYIDLMGYFISSLKTIFTSLPDWNVHLIPMRVTFFVFLKEMLSLLYNFKHNTLRWIILFLELCYRFIPSKRKKKNKVPV